MFYCSQGTLKLKELNTALIFKGHYYTSRFPQITLQLCGKPKLYCKQ